MAPLENLLWQGTIEKLGWALVHFVWQAAAVALLLALLLRLLRRTGANVRYVVACLALVLMVALPVVTMQFVEVEGPVAEVGPLPSPLPAEPTPLVEAVEVEAMPEFSGTPIPLETADLAVPVPWSQRIATALDPALPYLVLGWLIGVFGLSAWHLGGWAQLQRLKRRLVQEVSDPLRGKLDELADRLGVHRAVALLESAVVEVPTVVGWLRPVILLPTSALTGLTADQLEALLAHELAHIRRYDYLVNVLQTVAEILGFYHPGVWWVSHRIRVERENCCDDLAVRLCGDSVRYAKALTRLEEMRHRHAELAVAASGGHLVGRIGRLLGRPAIDDRRFAWLPGLVTLLIVAACVVPAALVLAAPEPPVPAAEETLDDRSEQPPAEKPGERAYAIRVDLAVLEALSDTPVDADTADQIRRLLGGAETTDSADPPVETTLDTLLPDAGELELTDEEADTLMSLLASRGLARIVARPTMEMWDGQPGRIGHTGGPNEPPDAPQDELTLNVRPEALPEGDATLLILELELKRTLPSGPGDDKPGTHVTAMATTVMAQNGYHTLIRRHEREPFVDDAGHATMILLLVKPTQVPVEPPAGAMEAPKSVSQQTGPPAKRPMTYAADVNEASEDTAAQVLLEVIVSEVRSNVTLDDLTATDVRHLLQEIYLAQKEGLGGSKYLPSVKNLQRPLSEVLQEHVIKPKVSGAGLKMLTDMLRTRDLAHTVAAPHILTRVGQPARLVIGDRGNDAVVTDATDADRFGLVLDVTPSLSDEPDTLALDTTLELRNFTGRMMAGQEDSPWLKFDSASLRGMSIIVHDGEYHLTAPSGLERRDQAGDLRMLLVLTKATVVGDRPPPSPGEAAPVRVVTEATTEGHPSEEDRAQVLLDFRVAEVRADRPMTREMAQEVADLLGERRVETDSGRRTLTSRPSADDLEIPPRELFERYAQNGCWDPLVLNAVIDLLESNEYMTTIASPQLLARENKQAQIKIRGEKYSQTTSVGVETVEAGVVINVTPRRGDDGLVVLELAADVTDLMPADEHSAPTARRRSRQTTLAVRDNTYFILPLDKMPAGTPKHVLYLLVRPHIIRPAAGIGNDRPAEKITLTPEWLLARQEYVNADPVVQELAKRIAELEADLIEARQSFTPQHRTIIRTQELRKAIERRLEQKRKELERQFNENFSGLREVTLSHGMDLLDALTRISEETGTQIRVDATFKTQPVTAVWAGLSAEAALDTTLKTTPYTFKKVHDTYLVYRPITLRFIHMYLHIALQDVARAAGVPIRVDADVTGEVTATLENVPVETALEILLAGTPYVAKQERDYYRVTKPKDRSASRLDGDRDPAVSSRPPADGKIRGVVRDERGRPAAGALVLPLPHGGHAVETDEEGRFMLEGPTKDRVIKELLARDPRRDLAGTTQLRDPNEPISIAVTAAVTFAGRVTDPQGRPIAGADVSPTIKGDDYAAGFGWTRWDPTDSNGVFELRALPTGYEYAIHAAAQGYGRQRQTLERIAEPGEKKLDSFVLPPADQSVSGVVLDEDDRPMAGVSVQAYGDHQPPRRAQANSAGCFTIDGLCTGPVKLWAWTSDNVWGGGDEAVAGDEKGEIYMRATRPCMLGPKNPPPSLVGRPMPSLAGLNVTLPQAAIRNKRVLVCFWKLSHDESRDCIRYLARRADELQREDIVVVGVQIWIRNEAQLRRWLAKNGVTFPVGMLDDLWQQRPEERATYRWGLNGALPWLVLTDAQHIVEAEGFALNELDAKIAGAERASTEGAGKKKQAIKIEARLLWASEMFLKDLGQGRPIRGVTSTEDTKAMHEIGARIGENGRLPLDAVEVDLLQRAVRKYEGRMLVAPRVTVVDGEEVVFIVGDEVPYIAGYDEPNDVQDEPTPQMEMITTGPQLKFKPELRSDGQIHIDSVLTLTRVEGAEERTYRDNYVYQVPQVDKLEFAMDDVLIRDGRTVLILGPKAGEPWHGDGKKSRPLLILLTARKADEEEASNAPAPS